MGNYHAIKLKEKLMLEEFQDKKNIMELDKNLLNDIKEEVFGKLLSVIFYHMTTFEFKKNYIYSFINIIFF